MAEIEGTTHPVAGLPPAGRGSPGARGSWGYVVTVDGRVIKASERDGDVLDDRGHRLGATVDEDGRPVGAIVRAA